MVACRPTWRWSAPCVTALVLAFVLASGMSARFAPTARAASMLYVGPGGGSGQCASPTYADIQSAVDAAAPNDTIHVCAGGYSLASTVTVSKDLTIEGDGAPNTSISGGGTVRLFDGGTHAITVRDITLEYGRIAANDIGGAIKAADRDGRSDHVPGNATGGAGGAIGATASVTVTNSTFDGNGSGTGVPTQSGGAIYLGDGLITVTNSTFAGNGATAGGGAIWSNHAACTSRTARSPRTPRRTPRRWGATTATSRSRTRSSRALIPSAAAPTSRFPSPIEAGTASPTPAAPPTRQTPRHRSCRAPICISACSRTTVARPRPSRSMREASRSTPASTASALQPTSEASLGPSARTATPAPSSRTRPRVRDLLFVAQTPPANGGGSCAEPDYNDIQSAVDDAPANGTIHVCAGTYDLTSTIDVPIALQFIRRRGRGDDHRWRVGRSPLRLHRQRAVGAGHDAPERLGRRWRRDPRRPSGERDDDDVLRQPGNGQRRCYLRRIGLLHPQHVPERLSRC